MSERFIEAAGSLETSVLDIVTWHYYPMQSRRCPVANVRAVLRNFEEGRLIEGTLGRTLTAKRNIPPKGQSSWETGTLNVEESESQTPSLARFGGSIN